MPNVMAVQPNIVGAICESSVISFLVPRRKVWLTPTARVPSSNAANIGERKTWTKSEFCTWQNSIRGKSHQKCVYCVPAHHTAKHRAKFGWLPLSDVDRCSKPKRETGWNLLGCPKLANRSQPLIGRSSPYCKWDKWRRYWCLTFLPIVDTCLSWEDLYKLSSTKFCDSAQVAIFCVIFASCISSEPQAAHFRHAF